MLKNKKKLFKTDYILKICLYLTLKLKIFYI